MRKNLALFLFLLLPFCLYGQNSLEAKRNILVFTHAMVIDVAGGIAKQDYTVIVTGDRIAAMGKTAKVRVPSGAQVVDASGKFLIPGLWDMHVHPSGKAFLPFSLANGVTGIRIMWGDPEDHEWRKEIETGHLLGPRMVIASPLVDGPKPYWRGSISVSSEAQARQVVDKVKADGADFVKVYQFLPRDLYFAIADEAKKQGMPFAGHVPISVSAQEASSAGQKSFEHLVGILPACSSRSADLLKGQQDDLTEGLLSKPRFWGAHVVEARQRMLDTYSPDQVAALCAVLKGNGTWQVPHPHPAAHVRIRRRSCIPQRCPPEICSHSRQSLVRSVCD